MGSKAHPHSTRRCRMLAKVEISISTTSLLVFHHLCQIKCRLSHNKRFRQPSPRHCKLFQFATESNYLSVMSATKKDKVYPYRHNHFPIELFLNLPMSGDSITLIESGPQNNSSNMHSGQTNIQKR